MFLRLKDVHGLGILYFSLGKEERECVICGKKTFFQVSASSNYFEGTEYEDWPCCQDSFCYDELVYQKRKEVHQFELKNVEEERRMRYA